MSKWPVQLYQCIIYFHFLSFCSSLNFYNTDTTISYAEFPKWTNTNNGEGELEFHFKTHKPNGFLLFCNDGDNRKNMFRLMLDGGSLHVFLQMGSDDNGDLLSLKETHIGTQWNDMEWHHVKITRNFRDVTIQIDDHEKILSTDGHADQLIITSNMIVGGDKQGIYEGFTGCIKNFAYPIGSLPKFPIYRTGYVSDGCEDTCTNKEQRTCLHEGRCRKYFQTNKISCDCKGTGYRGDVCNNKERVAYFAENTFITFAQTESLRNTRVNKIYFRFRSNRPSGIILYSGDNKMYFLIELHNGNVRIEISMGTEPNYVHRFMKSCNWHIILTNIEFWSVVSLSVGNGRLHDGIWHSVMAQRYGQQIIMMVDKIFSDQSSFTYYPQETCQHELQKIYLAGVKQPLNILASKSKRNYQGCLQQFYIQENGKELVHKGLSRNDIYTRVYGALKTNCHVERRYIFIDAPLTTRPPFINITSQPIKSTSAQIIQGSLLQVEKPNKLSEATVAWITGGICVGSIAMILTLACGFHILRKKYSGQFLNSEKRDMRKSTFSTSTRLAHDDDYSDIMMSLKRPKQSVVV